MTQPEFIWLSSNILPKIGVEQKPSGETIVGLRPQINIIHDFKKGNRLTIVFLDDGATFLIPSKEELEEIYAMHLANTNLVQVLRKYCDDNFEML